MDDAEKLILEYSSEAKIKKITRRSEQTDGPKPGVRLSTKASNHGILNPEIPDNSACPEIPGLQLPDPEIFTDSFI